MMTRAQLWTLIALTAVLWSAALFAFGVEISLELFKPFGTVVGVVGFCVVAFEKWLWKWSPFRWWLTDRPDISGTWNVELISDYVIPETNQKVPPKTCYMRIHQTYSTISMRLMTDESSSDVVAATISRSTADGYRVVGVYMNEPKLLIHERSPIHYGGIVLTIQGTPPSSLEGSYWTTRKTQGEMRLTNRNRKLFDDFKTAQEAFSSPKEGTVG